MSEKSQEPISRNWRLVSVLYAAFVLVAGGYFNYTQPYSSEPETTPTFLHIVLWTSLYAPVVVLPLAARWNVTGFGFTFNPYLVLAFLSVTPICAAITAVNRTSWTGAALEAYARTGEEIFFRGFLFALLLQFLGRTRWSWLWAAVGSSLLFALIHTQTFQAEFLSQYGSQSMPVIYRIVERLVNVFGIALVLALFRVGTRSILPGAIVHSMANGSMLALPFVLIIYGLMMFWAYKRGEQVVFGFTRVGAKQPEGGTVLR